MSTSTYIYIFGTSEIKIWGLTGRERLQRMVAATRQATVVDDIKKIPAHGSVLFLSEAHLFDSRVLAALINSPEKMVLYNNENLPVAVRTDESKAQYTLKNLINEKNEINRFAVFALPRRHLEDLKIDFQKNLKRKDPPYIFSINADNQHILEEELFAGSYKGVTDLVTKWVWPWPAFWSTHLCIRHGWQPNHVTVLSLVLAVLAGVAFWHGFFAIGLLMGWFMTFLDTVDGKLARVTVTSSRLGDVLDHGLDLIHPPFWYLAWGVGLANTSTPIPGLEVLMWLMFFGYVGGRLCEGVFQYSLASFDIFIWRQVDSFNRLITARRNPNLILLTFGWLIDRPGLGLSLVVAWHLISTGILTFRVLAGWREYHKQGALRSWLEDIDPGKDRNILAVRIFTRAPLVLKTQPSRSPQSTL